MTDTKQSRPEETTPEEHGSTTSPPGGKIHEATTPPGQGDLDDKAVEEGEGRLDQASGR